MFLNDTPLSVPCRSRYLILLLGACLVAACGNDPATSRSGASQPSDSDRAAAAAALAAAPTALTLTGPAAFEGATPVHCVASGANGLQINFRTGDADTPAVAVRIDDYRGSGPYPAQVFVTGRSPAGGLVTANGEAHLEVRQEDPPAAGAVVVLSGKLDGAYQGPTGGGSIAGRFAGCGYSKDRGSAPQEASATLVPSHEGSGADLAEDPPTGKADSSAKDTAQDVGSLPPAHPPQATKAAGRPHRKAGRAAHRRRR